MTRRWITLAAVAATVTALVACSKPAAEPTSQGQSSPATSGPPATSTPPATPVGEEQIGGAAVLADGRHPIFITTVDVGRKSIKFDLVVFLTGQKAKEEWAKAHPGEEGPPNDYMIVNNNPRLRTLPVADEVRILIIDPDNFQPDSMLEVSLSQLRDRVTTRGGGQADGPYWITVRAGKITRVEEQFVP
jgi:hypothetical protein